MASWEEVTAAAPEFADRVRRIFVAHRTSTLATLRQDGSPRISGIDPEFVDGEVVLGMMPGSLKLRDIQRDDRIALHSAPEDPPKDDPSAWPGDAKIAGRMVEMPNVEHPGERANLFRVAITEVVLTRVGSPADHLVIESWHEGRGLERRERR
ncbi:MAG TPA: pyridoxamine 5'-phosphate oxidase [Chloroflexota bacterium]|nr:pyridoxamine 5'-phosphate oxidase [Chloroflexota bacterium]